MALPTALASETMRYLRIPIWREARLTVECAALSRDPVLSGEGVTPGGGQPVLLVPGFLAGDLSLGLMARWLRHIGYEPCSAGVRVNVDCTSRALTRLEHQLECLTDHHGMPAAIVGHSRGGLMARILAVRRPDLVRGIVCLGSPLTEQFAVHPLVRVQVETVALLGTLGLQGLFSRDCRRGNCCASALDDAVATFADGVAFTSIYSRSDGVVDWRACLDPAAHHVEVCSSHCGMAVNGQVFSAVGRALAPEAPRRRCLTTQQTVRALAA
jgi:triacylglycerol lipase